MSASLGRKRQPSAAIGDLVSGFAAPLRQGRLLWMIQLFVDDSAERPYFCLGGCLARADDWMAFSDEWAAVAADDPPILYLKTKEAAALRGQLYRWIPEVRDAKLRAFEEVMSRHIALCTFCMLDLNNTKI